MEKIQTGHYTIIFFEGDEVLGKKPSIFGLRSGNSDTFAIYKVKEPPYRWRADGFVCKANKKNLVCTNGILGFREFVWSLSRGLNRQTIDNLMSWVEESCHIVRVERYEHYED